MARIEARGKIGIAELQMQADGSRATFQRDLAELEKAGRILRSYGMVRCAAEDVDHLWAGGMRQAQQIANLEAKRRIGQRAQELIGPQETHP